MLNFQKIGERIRQSNKWIKLYIALAVIQGISIIVLESIMASQNLAEANSLIPLDGYYPEKGGPYYDLIRRLNRTKWENIAFSSVQIWFVAMTIDASVYQNMPEVMALAVIDLICAILGCVQIVQSKKTAGMIEAVEPEMTTGTIDDPSVFHLKIVFYLAIVVTVLLGLFSFTFIYLSYMVLREVGWKIYKKIGADMRIQRLYTVFQLFVLTLKIDIFVEFLVSIFYVTQLATDNGGFEWQTWIQLVITVMILPMLYFAREAVALEKKWWMVIFIIFQLILVFGFALMISLTTEPGNFWYTYIVIIGLIFALITAGFGAWTMKNFDKGLKPFIQRGSDKKNFPEVHQQQQEPNEKSALNKNNDAWQIDDD